VETRQHQEHLGSIQGLLATGSDERSKLQAELDEARRVFQEDAAAWEAHRRSLQDELQNLQEGLAHSGAIQAERDHLKTALEAIEEEGRQRRAQIDHLEGLLATNAEERQRLEADFAAARQVFETDVASWEARHKALQDELQRLHDEVALGQTTQAERDALKGELALLQEETRRHQEHLGKLQGQLASERAEREEKARVETENWSAELRAVQRERDTLRADLARMEADLDRRREERDKVQGLLDSNIADWSAERSSIQVELDRVRAELTAAREQAEAKGQSDSVWQAEKDSLSDELARVRMGLKILETEHARSKALLDSARRSLETEREERDQRNAEAEAGRAERAALQAEAKDRGLYIAPPKHDVQLIAKDLKRLSTKG
jgi:chromosome segregation ATPase